MRAHGSEHIEDAHESTIQILEEVTVFAMKFALQGPPDARAGNLHIEDHKVSQSAAPATKSPPQSSQSAALTTNLRFAKYCACDGICT